MFETGDTICYPMHGVGRVESIEEREMNGESIPYYNLFFYNEGIKVMVPVSRAKEAGLRFVINSAQAEDVYAMLRDTDDAGDSNWNKRYRINLDKMRDGTAVSVAGVVKSLSLREKKRALSAGEKKMLTNARKILTSELSIACGDSEDQINLYIDRCIES